MRELARSIGHLGSRPYLAYHLVKRTIDVLVAATALVVLAIPMLTIALAVWLSDPRAPILFGQPRTGRNGRSFRVLKFRTMVRNADELKEQLRSQSVVPWPDFRLIDDPRVTRIGRFLRKTSLDELPQFVNVLRGEMSLVGPRPTSFAASTYTLWETGRLDFTPGHHRALAGLGPLDDGLRGALPFGDPLLPPALDHPGAAGHGRDAQERRRPRGRLLTRRPAARPPRRSAIMRG